MCCILIDNKMLNFSLVAFRFCLKNMEGEKDVIVIDSLKLVIKKIVRLRCWDQRCTRVLSSSKGSINSLRSVCFTISFGYVADLEGLRKPYRN